MKKSEEKKSKVNLGGTLLPPPPFVESRTHANIRQHHGNKCAKLPNGHVKASKKSKKI
jgi:hypothetical protein